MFVDVESPKSPLKIANILMAYDKGVVIKGVRQPKEKLTPEVCFDILKSTNHPRCIRDILQLIAKLPDEEQTQFKEVVIAAFDNREQPKSVLDVGQELAEKSGYGIEFAKLKKIKDGPYLFSEADARQHVVSAKSHFTDEDFSAYDKMLFLSDKKIQFDDKVKFPKNMEFLNSSDVSFYDEKKIEGCDLHGVQGIRFKDGAKVELFDVKNLPENMDFSMCDVVDLGWCDLSRQPHLRFKNGAKVRLGNADNLPANLDFSQCSEVDLSECDLSEQPNLRFKDGAKVVLSRVEDLPKNLDFSQCDEVDLGGCDLSEYPNLRFKDGAKVVLRGVKNLPLNLDFSQCDEVDLDFCDLCSQPNLRFKNGAKVKLQLAKNLPHNLDFSQCDDLDLSWCLLVKQLNLCFKKGAKVNLSGAVILPQQLDVSMCSDVKLKNCSLSVVKKLVFKNRKQMEDSCAELPQNWKGELVFTDDEQQQTPALGLAMAAKNSDGR